MVPPVPLGCHAQGLTVNVGPPSSAYQKQGRSLAQLNIDTAYVLYAKKTTRRDLALGLIHWDLSVRLGMPLRFLFRQKRVDCEKKIEINNISRDPAWMQGLIA